MSRIITAPGVLTNVQGQIDHVTDMYNDIKDNNLKPLTITLDPVSNANGAVSVTTEDDRITEDMKAVTLEVGTPEVFKAPVTVTTGAGTATLTCSNATGTSTVTVTFIKTSPVEGGEDYPPAVTSTEFDILADRIGSLSSLDTTDKSDLVSAVNEVNSKITKYVKSSIVTFDAQAQTQANVPQIPTIPTGYEVVGCDVVFVGGTQWTGISVHCTTNGLSTWYYTHYDLTNAGVTGYIYWKLVKSSEIS